LETWIRGDEAVVKNAAVDVATSRFIYWLSLFDRKCKRMNGVMGVMQKYTRLWASFFVVLVCAKSGIAQQLLEDVSDSGVASQLSATPDANDEVPMTQAESDMILLVDAPPNKNEEQLRSLFVDAINYKDSGLSADLERIRAVRISKRDYDDMKEMILGIADKSSSPVTDGVVSQDSERSYFWEVRLTGHRAQGKPERPAGIRVTYDRKLVEAPFTESVEEDFYLGSLQDQDARFRFYNLTTAHLKLDSDWEPKSYQFLFEVDGKEVVGEKQNWPKVAKQFFAHIPDFRGTEADRSRFFEILRSGDIGEVLVNDSGRRPVRLIHMDTVGDGGLNRGTVLSRSFALRVEPLTKKPFDFVKQEGVERVWVLMPLTREQCDRVVKQLDELNDPRVEVLEAIRQGAVLNPSYRVFRIGDVERAIPFLPNLPKDWEQPTVLIDEVNEPMWFEVGLTGGNLDQPVPYRPLQYRRTFHLPVGTKPQMTFDRKYQVIVYESKARAKNGQPFSYRSTLITDGNRDQWWRETRTPRWRPPQTAEKNPQQPAQ